MSSDDVLATPASIRPADTTQAAVRFAGLAAAVALAAVAIVFTFVGYIQSDDAFYLQAAIGWLTDPPYLGLSHWSIRHLIVLPIALSFRLLGQSEAALLLPSLCYAAALLALLGSIAWHLAGWRAAAIAVALAGTTPVIATGATVVYTDVPEAVFVIGSLWAWHRGRETGRAGLMVLSGLAAGCAIITRETTAALLLFYLLMFVVERGRGFKGYVLMASGFIVVFGADWLYLYAMSGDPLYRLNIALKGAQGDGPQHETADEAAAGLDRFGTVALPRVLRPFGAVFLNQNFGLLFWFAVPATAWLAVRGRGEVRRSAAVFLGFFAAWFVVSGYLLAIWLWVIPRYYVVASVLVVPLAVWLSRSMTRHPVPASVICIVLLGSGLALDLGSTAGTMAGERGLVAAVQAHPGTMHTDPATAMSAQWLLALRHLDARVSTDLPRPGDLYFYSSRPRRRLPGSWPLQTIPSDWTPVETRSHSRKWTGPLVRALGIENALPPALRAKLDPAPLITAVYRVGPAAPR